MLTPELIALRNLPKSKEKELVHASLEVEKGNYGPAIKLGIEKKDPSDDELLIRLSDRWKYLFKENLPLQWPVTTKQIPMIERCIKKNDPEEMDRWLDKLVKDRDERGILW